MFIGLFLLQWYETRRQQSQRGWNAQLSFFIKAKKSFSDAFSGEANNSWTLSVCISSMLHSESWAPESPVEEASRVWSCTIVCCGHIINENHFVNHFTGGTFALATYVLTQVCIRVVYINKFVARHENLFYRKYSLSHAIFTLHSFFFIRMLFFQPRLSILIFLPILSWKYSCIILKLNYVFCAKYCT